MLNSSPESLTNEEPVRIFTDWPKDWHAAFTLLARGGFIVSAAQQDGTVPLVEVLSQRGGEFRLVNPWGVVAVDVYRDRRQAERVAGATLRFATTRWLPRLSNVNCLSSRIPISPA